MVDLIDRQAAIDALGEQPTGWSYGEYEEGLISQWKSDVEAIKQLPSAEPKMGRWIDIDSETYTWKIRCDQCGHERSMMSTQGVYPRFCEGCGFKMEVDHGKTN